MDLPIHDQILWHACRLASERLGSKKAGDPLEYFPILVRGSWINDTNQVTVFTDYFTRDDDDAAPLANVDDAVRTLFRTYWKMQLEDVLARVKRVDAGLADRCGKKVAGLEDMADFGDYKTHDHLDVLEDTVEKEYVSDAPNALAQTVSSSKVFIKDRLRVSTTRAPDDRLSPDRVSVLGRALHSVADFFAHTNFVELFLWELAVQRKLDAGLVDYFNRSAKAYPFDLHLEDGFYTPLPLQADDWPEKKKSDLLCGMWYGEAPSATPLASCVFDTQDTAFSLIHLYANHLEQTKAESSEAQINLVFSILDVSGLPIPLKLLKEIVQISGKVQELLDAAGRAARQFLANTLVNTASAATTNPTAKALFSSAGAMIKHYQGQEAAEWARAGKLRYVAHALATDLGERVGRRTRENLRSLPHHSTLSKDHPPKRIDENVRFNLACFLATELSSQILEWHFGKETPEIERFDQLRDRWLVHPSQLLASPGKMGELVQSFFRSGWQGRLDRSVALDQWSAS